MSRSRRFIASAAAACTVLLSGCVSQPPWPVSYPDGVDVVLKRTTSLQALFSPTWDGRLLAFGPRGGRSLLWTPIYTDAEEFGLLGPGGARTYVGSRGPSPRFNPFECGWPLYANGDYEVLANFGRAFSVLSPHESANPEVRVGRIALLTDSRLLIDETVRGLGSDPSLWSASVLFLRNATRIAVRLRPGAAFKGLGKVKGRWSRKGDVLDIHLYDPPEGTRLEFDAEALAAYYQEGHLLVAVTHMNGTSSHEPAAVCFGGEDEAGGYHTRCVAFVFPTTGSEENQLSLHFVPREIHEPPEDDWAPGGF